MSVVSPPFQDDYRAYENLLKRVASSLNIQVEVILESLHGMVDVL